MTRILFVDDEPILLTALSRGLRRDRERWDMVFVDGAQAALKAMENEPFDAIVSDLRMPGMSGAELLEHVRERHRTTARILLSGNIEPTIEAMMRTFAHEVLSKPCPLASLRECIERQLGCGASSSARLRAALRAISEPMLGPRTI